MYMFKKILREITDKGKIMKIKEDFTTTYCTLTSKAQVVHVCDERWILTVLYSVLFSQ